MRLEGRITNDRGRGVAGVPVSNGESIVRTAADGRFRLSADSSRHTHVFVTVPSGWSAVDRFFRRIEPRPTGPIDFTLTRVGRPRRSIRFAAITDLHYEPSRGAVPTLSGLRRTLRRVTQRVPEAEFVIACGDLTDRGFRPDLTEVDRALRSLDRPVFPVFGAGHDGLEERKILRADKPWCRHYLDHVGPVWYSFDWGGFHFAVTANEDHHFTGPMLDAKRRWLARDLTLAARRGLERIVVVHCPPDRSLLKRLCRFDVRLVIGGHFHSFRTYRFDGMRVVNFPPLVMGGIDMMPKGFLELRASPGREVKFACHASAPLLNRPRPAPKRIAVWSHRVSSYFHRAGPLLDETGRLYVVASHDLGGGEGAILCLDAATGRRIWSTPTQDAVEHAPVRDGDRLYLNTQTGAVMCLNRRDGRPHWVRRLNGHPNRWLHAAPVVTADVVIAGHDRGGIAAFSARGGRRLWSTPPYAASFATNRGDLWPNYASAVTCGDRAVIPHLNQGIVCVDARSGEVCWEYDHAYAYYLPAMIRWRDRLWLPSPQPDAHLVQVDIADGRPQRRVRAKGITVAWCATDLRLFHVVLDRHAGGEAKLQCRRAATGRLEWVRPLGNDPTGSYPYLDRDGPNVQAPPVVVGDRVFVACTDGKLRRFDARSGRADQPIDLGSPMYSTPVFTGDAPRPGDRFWAALWSGQVVCGRVPGR